MQLYLYYYSIYIPFRALYIMHSTVLLGRRATRKNVISYSRHTKICAIHAHIIILTNICHIHIHTQQVYLQLHNIYKYVLSIYTFFSIHLTRWYLTFSNKSCLYFCVKLYICIPRTFLTTLIFIEK